MSNKKSLFLCATPLQAKIALKIISEQCVESFDVLYFTFSNSNEELNYYTMLSRNSKFSSYVHIRKKCRGFNSISTLLKIPFINNEIYNKKYSEIYLASIDNFIFLSILKNNPSAKIIGFDDGTANITPSSSYYNFKKSRKFKLVSLFFRFPTPDDIRFKMDKYFSIYPGFDNYVDKNKIVYISVFDSGDSSVNTEEIVTFFIGQPFSEYLDSKNIDKIKEWLMNQKIDYYVAHPREVVPIISNIPLLNKKGMLAEDAIYEKSSGRLIRIISLYSTVLFNIDCGSADKIYLSVVDSKGESERLQLISKTGSKVVSI